MTTLTKIENFNGYSKNNGKDPYHYPIDLVPKKQQITIKNNNVKYRHNIVNHKKSTKFSVFESIKNIFRPGKKIEPDFMEYSVYWGNLKENGAFIKNMPQLESPIFSNAHDSMRVVEFLPKERERDFSNEIDQILSFLKKQSEEYRLGDVIFDPDADPEIENIFKIKVLKNTPFEEMNRVWDEITEKVEEFTSKDERLKAYFKDVFIILDDE
ncbi:MAG: hypothetical protein LBM96_12485 [Methanobrevibacter sp.]|jgi:hypothetical protein|nr:hypothetical protein [Candidatus Methanoflexus mossambicus]